MYSGFRIAFSLARSVVISSVEYSVSSLYDILGSFGQSKQKFSTNFTKTKMKLF